MILATFVLPTGCHTPDAEDTTSNKAAIIDQLYLLEPNPGLIAEAKSVLESCGFEVDIWQGIDITVDFYYRLPSLGYKLIVLRVHSGLLVSLDDGQVVTLDTTYLFTAENYTATRYVTDQLTDKVSNAMMSDDTPLVFAVNSEYIKSAEGEFKNTVILALGCESYKYNDMATAFIEKGASVYIGWNEVVTLGYVDDMMLNLLKHLCTDNMTISQSLSLTMEEVGTDPLFGAFLKYCPAENGSRTVAELITRY
ncbi:MAG: hypothetical protein JXA17_08085 [Dehalococcoidales bacterium]|nr:hypothetical protein [Dehalococcoidales bacterium]